jgi:hypothetical protein
VRVARRTITITIAVSVFVPVVAAVVIWLVWQDDLTDADVVYCLSNGQRAGLADAAVTLGLVGEASRAGDVVVDGQEVPVSVWRERRGEDFERACSAIRPAKQGALTPLQSALLATFNVVVGGLLGFGSANLVQRFARIRQNGRSLRAAATAFLAAARAYARAWDDPVQPSDLAVQDRRAELMAELRMIRFEHPGSPAGAILDRLSTELSDQVFRQWRPQNRDSVENLLQTLETEVFELAQLIEHPGRSRARLRGAPGEAE